jgi:hypothetical protein
VRRDLRRRLFHLISCTECSYTMGEDRLNIAEIARS